MANFRVILSFIIVIAGWSAALGQEVLETQTANVREPRSFHRKRLCHKLGICEGQGYGQGGYQGNPINIAISQSQSSANEGGGGYGHGYTPNNYQYNQGYPNYGGYSNYGGYPNYGYHGYNKLGYYGNEGGYNNQFNGNYYGGQGGGYGFRRPYGGYDEDGDGDNYDYRYNDDDGSSRSNFAAAGSFAEAGSKN